MKRHKEEYIDINLEDNQVDLVLGVYHPKTYDLMNRRDIIGEQIISLNITNKDRKKRKIKSLQLIVKNSDSTHTYTNTYESDLLNKYSDINTKSKDHYEFLFDSSLFGGLLEKTEDEEFYFQIEFSDGITTESIPVQGLRMENYINSQSKMNHEYISPEMTYYFNKLIENKIVEHTKKYDWYVTLIVEKRTRSKIFFDKIKNIVF